MDKKAIIIANQGYPYDRGGPLYGVLRDCTSVYDYLKADGWDIEGFVINGTANDAAASIDNVAKQHDETNPIDHVLVYYAGHGAVIGDGADKGKWYPVPLQKDEDTTAQQGLTVAKIVENLGSCCKFLTIIIDACEAGKAKIKLSEPDTLAKTYVVQAAVGDAKEYPMGGGLLTTSLLNFLATGYKDGLKWSDLYDALEAAMRRTQQNFFVTPLTADAEISDPITLGKNKRAEVVDASKPMLLLKYLADNAPPPIALGAILGHARDVDEKEPLGTLEQLRNGFEEFAQGSGLPTQDFFDEEGNVRWIQWRHDIAIKRQSPFGVLRDITPSETNALKGTLERGLFGEEQGANDSLDGWHIEIHDANRFQDNFRVVIIRAYERGSEPEDGKSIFIARILRNAGLAIEQFGAKSILKGTEKTDNSEQETRARHRFNRANREYNRAKESKVGDWLPVVKNPLKIALPVSYETDAGETICEDLTFGTMYPIKGRVDDALPLDSLLLDQFKNPTDIKNGADFLIQKIDAMFKKRSYGFSAPAKGKNAEEAPYHWSQVFFGPERYNDIKKVAAENCAPSFIGTRKSVNLNKEARIAYNFLDQIDERAGTINSAVFNAPTHGDIHQKNIIVATFADEDRDTDEVTLIDFENADDARHMFIDIAVFEVSLILFLFLDHVDLKVITKIMDTAEQDWVTGDKGIVPKDNFDMPSKSEFIDRVFGSDEKEGEYDYLNASEKACFAAICRLRQYAKSSISFTRGLKGADGVAIEVMREQLKQYYVILFLRVMQLLDVKFAPKAAVIRLASWLVFHIEHDPDLLGIDPELD